MITRIPRYLRQGERSDRSCVSRARSAWPWVGRAGPGFGALGPASLLALSLALPPWASAQDENQRPASDATTQTSLPSGSEPGPDEGVEQETESSATTDSTATVDEPNDGDDADRGDESGPPQGEPAAEVFVPTEEISEDFAVPFPVDI